MRFAEWCEDMEPLAAVLARSWDGCRRTGDYHGQITCLTTLATSIAQLQSERKPDPD